MSSTHALSSSCLPTGRNNWRRRVGEKSSSGTKLTNRSQQGRGFIRRRHSVEALCRFRCSLRLQAKAGGRQDKMSGLRIQDKLLSEEQIGSREPCNTDNLLLLIAGAMQVRARQSRPLVLGWDRAKSLWCVDTGTRAV